MVIKVTFVLIGLQAKLGEENLDESDEAASRHRIRNANTCGMRSSRSGGGGWGGFPPYNMESLCFITSIMYLEKNYYIRSVLTNKAPVIPASLYILKHWYIWGLKYHKSHTFSVIWSCVSRQRYTTSNHRKLKLKSSEL